MKNYVPAVVFLGLSLLPLFYYLKTYIRGIGQPPKSWTAQPIRGIATVDLKFGTGPGGVQWTAGSVLQFEIDGDTVYKTPGLVSIPGIQHERKSISIMDKKEIERIAGVLTEILPLEKIEVRSDSDLLPKQKGNTVYDEVEQLAGFLYHKAQTNNVTSIPMCTYSGESIGFSMGSAITFYFPLLLAAFCAFFIFKNASSTAVFLTVVASTILISYFVYVGVSILSDLPSPSTTYVYSITEQGLEFVREDVSEKTLDASYLKRKLLF